MINISYYFYFVYTFRCVSQIKRAFDTVGYLQKMTPKKNHYIQVSLSHWHWAKILVNVGKFWLLYKTPPNLTGLQQWHLISGQHFTSVLVQMNLGYISSHACFVFKGTAHVYLGGLIAEGKRDHWGFTQWLLEIQFESNTYHFHMHFTCQNKSKSLA